MINLLPKRIEKYKTVHKAMIKDFDLLYAGDKRLFTFLKNNCIMYNAPHGSQWNYFC